MAIDNAESALQETTERLRPHIAAQLPQARTDLAELVAFPSVHEAEPEACSQAAAYVAAALAELDIPGLDTDSVQFITAPDDSQTIYAHRPAAPGKPTVLLYSHYDVQPAGDLEAWQGSPWELREDGGRWYGRGTADCKGNLVMHLVALRALAAAAAPGEDPLAGLGLRIIVEGSEETGGGGLEKLLAQRPELCAADAVCIADSGNTATGVPTLTTSLRGVVNTYVDVYALESGVHSGQYGGAAPDALAALIALLASLRDPETGATTVDGLDFSGTWSGHPYPEKNFRRDATMLPETHPSTAGEIADLLWARPAVNILGIDCPSTTGAVGALQPHARALVQLRVPPGMDPVAARDVLIQHLQARRPWGARVEVTPIEGIAQPFTTATGKHSGEVRRLLGAALTAAYGAADIAEVGMGGSIPLCTEIQELHPDAEFALYGVEDPAAAIHSPNESVDPTEIEHIALAEASFLLAYAQH